MKTPAHPPAPPNPEDPAADADADASGLRRLLQLLMLKTGLARQGKLERQLQAQRQANALLGALLVKSGGMSEQQLAALLHMQDHLPDPRRALKVADGIRLRLGELLIRSGRATPEQIEEALAEQASTGARLGRIAVRQGWLKPLELRRALRFQERQMDPNSEFATMKLGEILLATGQVTQGDLDAALERQRHTGRPLGVELVEAGCLRPAQLAVALRVQRSLSAMLLCAVLAGMALAPTPAEASLAAASQPMAVSQVSQVSPLAAGLPSAPAPLPAFP